ncbi:hypothetical protein HDU76_009100 [Blyttiomyces sp. JEL0837]|nr:hypothetical protein HDU76_009100 [Blyttiomyces sp. JEL0837]
MITHPLRAVLPGRKTKNAVNTGKKDAGTVQLEEVSSSVATDRNVAGLRNRNSSNTGNNDAGVNTVVVSTETNDTSPLSAHVDATAGKGDGGKEDQEDEEIDTREAEIMVSCGKSRVDGVGFLTQLMVLNGRSFKQLVRTPTLLLAHWIMAAILGIFIGGVFRNADNSLAGVQGRLGSLFFLLALIGFSGLSGIGAFATDRQLFMRERNNRFYGPMPYYISRVLFDVIPLRMIPSIMMSWIAFAMIGLSSSGDHFVKFIIVMLVFSAQIGFLCMFFAIVIADVGAATLYGAIVILFKTLFAGLLVNPSQITVYLRWIQYISFFRYSYEALVVNDLNGLQIVDTVAGAQVNIPASIVLTKFGFDLNSFWQDFVISAGIAIFMLLINAVLIFLIVKEKR